MAMRIRKTNVLAAVGVGVGVLFMLYLIIDTITINLEDAQLQKVELSSLETKLRGLEGDLLLNQKTIDQIKDTVAEIREEQSVAKEESRSHRARGHAPVNKTYASVAKADYEFARAQPQQCDIRMSEVYDALPFDNPDGGVWKQGWTITYDQQAVTRPENKLKVFVVPHSHCDPGWIKTYEKYYQDQVKHILDNMVRHLSENPKWKFMYAEVSFFSKWWNEQSVEVRETVMKLLSNGQFEIITGGWVMSDEANSFYYATIEQMMTGHEWLNLNLGGYKPNVGWSIDPFGLSPTMAYLQKRIGFDAMLIQRSHYSVKKHLAKSKDLEFMWRQHWDHQDSSDMLTHMMPFYSYDVPHTCGPDPKVCCQFDFDRLPGGIASCPWRVPPKEISDVNVAERSRTLLDQYRKKSELFKSNVLFVPLGDDFRYDTAREWSRQFKNYERIMDHINSSPELNAEVQFGTLGDYFSALREESKAKTGKEEGMFKTLSGDFFTYADRDDHYWSGYYTSRPFYKSMNRILEGYLRAGEIMYSMMWAEMEYVGSDFQELANPLMENLVIARRSLSLFQHHDGITGTAKDHVVVDYANMMLESIEGLQVVMSQSAHYLLTSAKTNYKPQETVFFDLDDKRDHHYALPKQRTIVLDHADEVGKVVVFNSHARSRSEVVTVKVSAANVRVYKINLIDGDEEEESVECQLSPVWDDAQGQIENSEFYLSFLAQTKGLALQSYFVKTLRPEEGVNTDMDNARIRVHNSAKHPFQVPPFQEVDVFETGEAFELRNGYVRASFDKDGMLQAVTTIDDGKTTKTQLQFVRYGTRRSGDKSGAYLFLPDGPAKPIPVEGPLVRIVEGKIISYIEVVLAFAIHTVTLKSSPGVDGTGIQIDNLVDVSQMNNAEVAMRISTDVDSGDDFFTDLNGFQMIRRKRLAKIPLQANYYPIPSMLYLQDDESRVSMVTRQSLGGSSLSPGQFEIMMDRRLMQDDNRGLFQGVKDNHPTPHSFYLLVERKTKNCQDEFDDVAASYPSLLALAVRHSLVNPYFRLIWTGPAHMADTLTKSYEPVDKDLSCDISVVNLRTMQGGSPKPAPSEQTTLIVHRQGFNGCYKPVGMTCSTNGGKMSIEELFPELFSSSVKQKSLSLLYDGFKLEKGFTVSLKPMELYSFVLQR